MYNAMNNPYQTNSIMTASPQQLILMLYNGAIKFCNQAIEALENKNMAQAHKYNLRVQDIMTELRAGLDFKYDIAKDLDAMYEIIYQLLIEANIEKNSQKLSEIKGLLVEFRDLWQIIIKKNI